MNFLVGSHTVLLMSSFSCMFVKLCYIFFFLVSLLYAHVYSNYKNCIPKMKCYIIHTKKYNSGNNAFYLNRVNKTETLYGGVCASPDDDDDDSDEEVLCTCSDKISRCSTNELIFSCIGLGSLAKGKSKIAFKYLFSDIHNQYDYFFFFYLEFVIYLKFKQWSNLTSLFFLKNSSQT